MLWVKAFHIVFVVSWYVGLLYLPRLFVYHASTEDALSMERFALMERKLFQMMTIGAAGSIILGVWLLAFWWEVLHTTHWLQLKIALVAGLVAYHLMCGKIIKDFAELKNIRSPRFYRFFNEIPAVALVLIAILVVVKPF